MIAVIGEIADMDFLRYQIPGYGSLILAVLATYRFLRFRQEVMNFLIYFSWFVWYHFQIINPVTGPQQIEDIASYNPTGRLIGLGLGSIGPAMLYLFGNLWLRVLRPRVFSVVQRAQGHEAVGMRQAKIWFYGLFVVIGLLNVLRGQFFIGSILAVVYMRSADAPEEAFARDIEGSFGSAGAITQSAVALLLLWMFFFRRERGTVHYIIGLLIAVWAGSFVLSGTRTYLILFAGSLAMLFIGSGGAKGFKTFLFGGIVAVTFLLAQVMNFYRGAGFREVSMSETFGNVMKVQGLETLADQTRSVAFYLEHPESRWFDVNPFLGFFVGLVHRPIEYAYFLVPRSMWLGKPIDPSFTEFTRYSLICAGFSDVLFKEVNDGKDTGFGTSNTTGFLGRDIIRYGPLGAVSISILVSALLAWTDILFVAGRNNRYCLYMAAGCTGTIFAMLRGPEPMWMLALMPAVAILGLALLASARASVPQLRPMPRKVLKYGRLHPAHGPAGDAR
jgi:hypothetical protein